MKKFVSLPLCVSVAAASLLAAGSAAEPDPDGRLAVNGEPGNPDPAHSVPAGEDTEDKG